MAKEFDPEDPMELVGVAVPGGDEDQVLDDIVLEYLFMGWKPLQIMHLFRSPYYAATHQIYLRRGEAYVRARMQELTEQWDRGWIRAEAPGSSNGGEQDA